MYNADDDHGGGVRRRRGARRRLPHLHRYVPPFFTSVGLRFVRADRGIVRLHGESATSLFLVLNHPFIHPSHHTPNTGTYVANRVSDKLTALHHHIYCCRSGSAADTQALSDYVRYFLASHRCVPAWGVCVSSTVWRKEVGWCGRLPFWYAIAFLHGRLNTRTNHHDARLRDDGSIELGRPPSVYTAAKLMSTLIYRNKDNLMGALYAGCL